MDLEIRPARRADAGFLIEMLVQAAFWRPDQPSGTVQTVLDTPSLAHYIAGWPRPGDLGVIAVDQAQPIGAAWLRFLPGSDPGYGYVADDIPELGMGVRLSARRMGVGSRLLAALIDSARAHGITAVSLSVERDNHAAMALYDRFGFRRVGEVDNSFTMVLALPRLSD